MTPLYFGCWDGTGHFVYTPGGGTLSYYDEQRRCARRLDGGYPPPRIEPRWGPLPAVEESEPQGVALLHHEGERTILAFWDRTADQRPGAHSTFLLPGILAFDEAVAAARAAFPWIWRRLDAAGVRVRLAGGGTP